MGCRWDVCGMRMTAGCWWIFSRSGFLPWMVCFLPPSPPTWQAVKCGSLWCVQALDCIHAHRSRQPLIHWMTSHKRDKPVRAVVTGHFSVTWIGFLCVALHILLFLSVYYSHATGNLLLSAATWAGLYSKHMSRQVRHTAGRNNEAFKRYNLINTDT